MNKQELEEKLREAKEDYGTEFLVTSVTDALENCSKSTRVEFRGWLEEKLA